MDNQYVAGLDKLLVRLKNLAEAGSDRTPARIVSTSLRKAGKLLQEDMQRRVRVKTGALKENIIVTKKRTGNKDMIEVDVTVRYKAKAYADNSRNRRTGKIGQSYKNYGPLFYARFLEFGTWKMPGGFPFMRPAFEANKEQLPEIFKASLILELEKVNA